MDYIRFAIDNRVKVAVGVLLLLLFGFLALFTIPVQLVPNVDQPVITVETRWTGKDPIQIERDILEEQEDVLKRVTGLAKMEAIAQQGVGTIELQFYVGTDISAARLDVSNKLEEVPDYPEGVDEPVITVADSASENAIAWMIFTSDDPDFNIESLRDPFEERIKPFLERAEGVSEVNVFGGREREVHIYCDPRRLAQRGISFEQLLTALRQENINISAGDLTEGRRDWRVRTVGEFDDLDEVRRTVIREGPGGPVRIRDVADVRLTLEERRAFVRAKGQRALAMNAIRESGSNVITAMEDLKSRLERVQRDVLPTLGPKLKVEQVYDETVYIYDAINLVLRNLWLGGTLAILILTAFLRRIRPTAIVALAIPVSVVGTFLAMTGFGRNLNVVSLAGMAFAVGLVVDNAIVVLENIDRHLGMGKQPKQAAYDGAKEVWGAILASTLTTLAVFVPVLFMQEEAGQLFRDIALAICAAVTLSLIVSVTVIPSASARFLKADSKPGRITAFVRSFFGLVPLLASVANGFASLIRWLCAPRLDRWLMRLGVVTAITVAALTAAWLLMPPASYLPNGNRNLIFGIMITPPAYSIEHNERIGHRLESQLKPYWEAETYAETQKLPKITSRLTGQQIASPPVENFFFVSFTGTIFMGASSEDKTNVQPLSVLLSDAMNTTPGAFAFAFQPSIFGRGVGGANAIEVEVLGNRIDSVRRSAGALFGTLFQEYGKVRPEPGNFNLAGPELVVEIDRVKAAEMGVDVSSLGRGVESLIDGALVGDYRYEGESIDMRLLRDPDYPLEPEDLGRMPLAVGTSPDDRRVVPLSSIATIRQSTSPQEILRIEEQRAVRLTVEPPPAVPLQTAEEQIAGIVEKMRQDGAIAPDVDVAFAGTADKLTQVKQAMLGAWEGFTLQSLVNLFSSRLFLALLVVFLLMAALFESFAYPFAIMFSVPLAAVGGFIGLALVRTVEPTQQLDVLTMLGFVILIGIVVNNAILIVHQALNFMRGIGDTENLPKGQSRETPEIMTPQHAIAASVASRIRPIFMTTLTSVFGMLPLVVMGGAGSELYKGLGSVVVGGLLVSAIFTLLVVPLMFSMVVDIRLWLSRVTGTPLEDLPTLPGKPSPTA